MRHIVVNVITGNQYKANTLTIAKRIRARIRRQHKAVSSNPAEIYTWKEYRDMEVGNPEEKA